MDHTHEEHPPADVHPDDAVALGKDALVRDLASGTTTSVAEWLATCAEREDRPIDECRDALMNAIARGDVRVEDAGVDA